MISREQAGKYYPRARLPALEQSPADGDHLIGRDPRRMSTAELTALGHQARPLLAVIRAKCLDCVGYEPSEVRKCSRRLRALALSHGTQSFPRNQPGAARTGAPTGGAQIGGSIALGMPRNSRNARNSRTGNGLRAGG